MIHGALFVLSALGASPVPAAAVDTAYSFVVLGHLRGDRLGGLNPKLAEVLGRVRELRPAFAVLTGDMIWGDVEHNPSDTLEILREWTALDSALATLGVPIYRVPGNHDINDLRTRDIYRARYGALPAAVTLGRTRLLLLSAVWTPADGDTSKMLNIRGVDLSADAVSWLRAELGKPGFDHTFAFMHHLLWWETDAEPWWRDVHPLLASARVDALFSGDLGPLKFSTRVRDGVRYYQSAIETQPSLEILRMSERSRTISAQFDNFLEVRVNGSAVEVRPHAVGEVSSGAFTPDHYAAVHEGPVGPVEPLWRRVWTAINSPKRLVALTLGLVGLVSVSVGAGWWARGRRRG